MDFSKKRKKNRNENSKICLNEDGLLMHRLRRPVEAWIFTLVAVLCLSVAKGQEPGPASESELAAKQIQVTERYRRLEELLMRLAEVEAEENPERSALLLRAARQSRDTFVLEKLLAAGDSLKSEQFAKALESQGAAKEGLDKLLTLLLSEDRPKRIRDEKKRIADMIKELKVVERLQRSTRARTENGAEITEVSEEQSKISERSEKVNEELKDDEAKKAESESKEGDGKQEDGKQEDGKQSEGKQEEGKQEGKEKEGKQNESEKEQAADAQDKSEDQGKQSEMKSPDEPSESQPSEGEASPQDQGQQQQQQPQSPEQQAQSQLDKAIKQMRQAEKELEEAKRDKAVEQQKKAEENLRAAIDRLEKILRQLREEEMQRELARLESRLRKMAQMQVKVLDETKRLAAVPESQRDRQVDIKSGNLGFEEKKIVLEADRAMLLLREEGSSVAFPEVMAQVRGDMQRVSERLATTKLDLVTIGLQDDILAALEEMIAALQQAQRDLEKKKQEQQQGQGQSGGQQGEQPLVEQIAELKLIRTMESRIKSTTERYAGMIEEESSDATDVLPLLKDLSERQSNLYRVTRDLVLKRNQ
jgi:hypothetical protein